MLEINIMINYRKWDFQIMQIINQIKLKQILKININLNMQNHMHINIKLNILIIIINHNIMIN